MIKFRCENCDKKIGVPEKFAGKLVKCPQCTEAARVPQLELEPEPALEIEPVPAPDNIWSDDLLTSDTSESSPLNDYLDDAAEQPLPMAAPSSDATPKSSIAKSVLESAKTSSRLPLAIIGSFIGALVGGLAWAGIVYATEYEVGIVAWGVGFLAGLGSVLLSNEHSTRIGVIAAAMAVIGILIGKILIIQWVVGPQLAEYYKNPEITEQEYLELVNDPEYMFEVGCHSMVTSGRYTADLELEVIDYFYGEYNGEPSAELLVGYEQTLELINGWPTPQKRLAIRSYIADNADLFAEMTLNEVGFVEKMKASLSLIDILWFFLAVSSAFKLGTGFSGNE